MRRLIALFLIWFAFGTGASALAGYLFEIPWLYSWDNRTPMAINTAASIMALAIAFILWHRRKECAQK